MKPIVLSGFRVVLTILAAFGTATLSVAVAEDIKSAKLPPGMIRGPSAEVLSACLEGRGLRNQGNYDGARTSFDKALALAREKKDRSGEGWALSNIASTYRYEAGLITISAKPSPQMPLVEKAAYFYEQARKIARESEDHYNEAYATLYLGVLAAGQGNADKAMKLYEETLPLFKAVDDNYYQARTFTFMGLTALHVQGKPDKALPYFEQALPHFREAEVWHEAAAALREMDAAYDRLAAQANPQK